MRCPNHSSAIETALMMTGHRVHGRTDTVPGPHCGQGIRLSRHTILGHVRRRGGRTHQWTSRDQSPDGTRELQILHGTLRWAQASPLPGTSRWRPSPDSRHLSARERGQLMCVLQREYPSWEGSRAQGKGLTAAVT